MSPHRPAAVVVLAAGEGTRMKSATPKVLHEVGGRSLVAHAVTAAGALDPEHLCVVVGHGRDAVREHLAQVAPEAVVAVQEQQHGTGHAVECALDVLPPLEGTVVVTYGDVPLLTGQTLAELVAAHVGTGSAVTVLTAVVDDPTGYGRVLRAEDGSVAGIVEHKDADDAQRAVREINSGIYTFDAEVLRDGITRLERDNAQGELYLTDVLAIAREDGRRVSALVIEDAWQTEGVNDRVQLAAMHRELNRRTLEAWMRSGVTVVDPATTWVDSEVTLDRDTTLLPGTQLHGRTTVATGARIGPDCELTDTVVGSGATIRNAVSVGAEIGAGATVGPYTYLRPGTRLGPDAKAGGFVEMKKAVLGPGAKVPHLSYVGDADIGEGANIGAGTIVANYDGVAKNHTEVGAHSFVGSNSVLVAPVEIADGAYVAAGSTVISTVHPGELAVGRGKQRNIAGWVARRRAGTRTAKAAEAAGAGQGADRRDDSAAPDQDGEQQGRPGA